MGKVFDKKQDNYGRLVYKEVRKTSFAFCKYDDAGNRVADVSATVVSKVTDFLWETVTKKMKVLVEVTFCKGVLKIIFKHTASIASRTLLPIVDQLAQLLASDGLSATVVH